ncbi:MAG: hypothetical protein A2Y76_15560 [Planctomycetes bacterium RBG_13_60_9]|nr:MAG: hypothetical protein A2Y76_15560 [Planctomycetes bacterium RBG_13_60_9]
MPTEVHSNGWALSRANATRVMNSVFARQVGSTMLAHWVTLVVSMGTAAITARWLGPYGKGQLSMLLLVPGILQLFLSVGMNIANAYYAGSGRLRVDELTANSMMFSLLGTAVAVVIVLLLWGSGVLSVLVPGVSTSYLLLGMVALPLSLLSGSLRGVLHGLRHILTLNILDIVQSVLRVLMTALFVACLGLNVAGALMAAVAIQAVGLIASGWCLRRKGARFWPRWNPQVVQPTLSYGMKSYIGNLLQFFNYRFDAFVVNFFLGPAGVGMYGVSVTLAELLWQLPNAASYVLFPKAANSTHETMNRVTPWVFWFTFAVSFVGAVGLALFGRLAIRIVFSSAFLNAYTPLLVLLPGVMLLGAAKILTNDIAGRGYPHYNSITAGMSLVVTVVLDLALIPTMGVVGAALASTLAYALTFLASVVFYISVSRKPSAGRASPVQVLPSCQ